MTPSITCQHCGKTLPRNPRIKKQKFCSSLTCQNARKRLFDKRTWPTPKGKVLRQTCNKRWRDSRPAHEYQKVYRETHPEYVIRNRELQRERNKKRQKASAPMIVKTDALLLQPMRDGLYAAFKIKSRKIVKMDTLLIQLQAHTELEAFFPANPG